MAFSNPAAPSMMTNSGAAKPRATKSSRRARQAASLSPPMLRKASSTFWPSRRTPSATNSDRLVAFLSKRTRTTVPSRIRRTMSSPARSRFCQASQSDCTLRQVRLTVSLPTARAEQRGQGAPDPSSVGARQIGADDQPFGLHRQALVSRQRLAAPLRLLAIAVGDPCSGNRHRHRPERAEQLAVPVAVAMPGGVGAAVIPTSPQSRGKLFFKHVFNETPDALANPSLQRIKPIRTQQWNLGLDSGILRHGRN